MTEPIAFADVWRGAYRESRHRGHLVVAHADSGVILALGDPDRVILPRSSAKMIQALPLVESGAADSAGLTGEHLALACASHLAQPRHTSRVSAWLDTLGLDDSALRCGAQPPGDEPAWHAMIRAGDIPHQGHNNCSGKHSGFLTLTRHLGAGPEYIDIDHPVQQAVRDAFEDMTGLETHGWAIDGCSAPNFATPLAALARAMARFAAATEDGDARTRAAWRLARAMMAHPELVRGEGGACTELMRAANGRAAIKTGAEGVYVAILPERRIGAALKIADGATRAAECAIAAVLVALGALEADHPSVTRHLDAPVRNWRGLMTGHVSIADPLKAELARL